MVYKSSCDLDQQTQQTAQLWLPGTPFDRRVLAKHPSQTSPAHVAPTGHHNHTHHAPSNREQTLTTKQGVSAAAT